MGNATEAEVREALGDGFPKHPLHKIVCIEALSLVANPRPPTDRTLEGRRGVLDSEGGPLDR